MLETIRLIFVSVLRWVRYDMVSILAYASPEWEFLGVLSTLLSLALSHLNWPPFSTRHMDLYWEWYDAPLQIGHRIPFDHWYHGNKQQRRDVCHRHCTVKWSAYGLSTVSQFLLTVASMVSPRRRISQRSVIIEYLTSNPHDGFDLRPRRHW